MKAEGRETDGRARGTKGRFVVVSVFDLARLRSVPHPPGPSPPLRTMFSQSHYFCHTRRGVNNSQTCRTVALSVTSQLHSIFRLTVFGFSCFVVNLVYAAARARPTTCARSPHSTETGTARTGSRLSAGVAKVSKERERERGERERVRAWRPKRAKRK